MQSLKDFLEEALRKNLVEERRMQPWNIGVEHEFFLMSPDGLPSTIEDSQRFLLALSQQKSFAIFDQKKGKILKVSKETPNKGYSQIKYDHEPHLMEISSCFFDNLDSLNFELKDIFDAIEKASQQSNTKIVLKDKLEISPTHPRVSSGDTFYEKLRQFRKDVLTFSNKQPNPELENYAAVIAATQIHISGTKLSWITHPELVERLYKYEPFIQGWANAGTSPKLRWNSYRKVYDKFPLIGFPDLKKWTLELWLSALRVSPIFKPDQTGSLSTINTITLVEHQGGHAISDTWHAIRDLQIIRPKIYGSLEFRADPAQPSLERIMALAALRLGISIYVATNKSDPEFISKHTFQSARDFWWLNSEKLNVEKNHDIVELALQTLRKYRPMDLKYLEKLVEENNRQAG